MRVAIITAIIGGIDEPKDVPAQPRPDPLGPPLDITRHFFSDKDVPEHLRHFSPRVQALYFKTQMHEYLPDYDLYIWVDGKIQITTPDFVQQCITQVGSNDFAILKHHERTCVYQEINHILHCMSKGNEYLLARYKDRPLLEEAAEWKSMGYPKGNGLGDCKIFIVRNTEKMNEIFNKWWKLVSDVNYFDQTAIQVVCWLFKEKIHYLNFKQGSFGDVPHKLLQ